MTYEEFKQIIRTKKLTKLDYYAALYEYADELLNDVDINSQAKVAPQLRLHQGQLSTVVNMLKAYKYAVRDNS